MIRKHDKSESDARKMAVAVQVEAKAERAAAANEAAAEATREAAAPAAPPTREKLLKKVSRPLRIFILVQLDLSTR